MTQKNLRPQQATPVQREINTTSAAGSTGLELLGQPYDPRDGFKVPFAGDDAE